MSADHVWTVSLIASIMWASAFQRLRLFTYYWKWRGKVTLVFVIGAKLCEWTFHISLLEINSTVISTVKQTRCANVSNVSMYRIYFIWSNTPHVSHGLSVHHQEFKTVHTATGICQTDTAVCLLAGITLYMFRTVLPSIIISSRLYILQQAYVKQILLSAW